MALSFYPKNFEELPSHRKEEVKKELKPKTGPYWRKYNILRGKLERKSQNYPIQGTSGLITKMAAILIRREQLKLNYPFQLINLVHDEINGEAPEAYANTAAKIIEENMVNAGLYWCKVVPLKAKAIISQYWDH